MEIIFRGQEPHKKVHTGTCTNCKTRVRYEEWEGTIVYDQRDGDYIKVPCPVCGRVICTSI